MTSAEIIARKSPRWPMVLLRLFAAYYLIFIGVLNWQATVDSQEFVRTELARLQSNRQFEWFQAYLDRVISRVSDSDVFVWLVIGGPLLVGALLALGLLTRLSSLVAIVLVLHVALVQYHAADAYQLLFFEMQLAVLLVILLSASGRRFGLDGIFWRRRMRRKYDRPTGGEAKTASQKPGAPDVVEPIPLSKAPVQPRRPLRVEETEGFFTTPVAPRKPQPRPAPPRPITPATPTPQAAPPTPRPTPTPPDEIPLSEKRMNELDGKPTPAGGGDDIVVSDLEEDGSKEPPK